MCCTAKEPVVRAVDASECLLCNRLVSTVFDKPLATDFANYPDLCCMADQCGAFTANLYNDEMVVCNAFQAVRLVVHEPRKKFGAACTNNRCFWAYLAPGEQLACKRFDGLPDPPTASTARPPAKVADDGQKPMQKVMEGLAPELRTAIQAMQKAIATVTPEQRAAILEMLKGNASPKE